MLLKYWYYDNSFHFDAKTKNSCEIMLYTLLVMLISLVLLLGTLNSCLKEPNYLITNLFLPSELKKKFQVDLKLIVD